MKKFLFIISITFGLAVSANPSSLFMELSRLEMIEHFCGVSIDQNLKNQIKIEIMTIDGSVTVSDIETSLMILKNSIQLRFGLHDKSKTRKFCKQLIGTSI